jgi:hypothetical protein
MLTFDAPKLATGGNGNGQLPPDRRAFAQPGPTPQWQAPKAEAPVAPSPEPAIVARPPTASSVALKAKRIRNIVRFRARLKASIAKFRADLAAWQASRSDDEKAWSARLAYESNIRAKFRALHGRSV